MTSRTRPDGPCFRSSMLQSLYADLHVRNRSHMRRRAALHMGFPKTGSTSVHKGENAFEGLDGRLTLVNSEVLGCAVATCGKENIEIFDITEAVDSEQGLVCTFAKLVGLSDQSASLLTARLSSADDSAELIFYRTDGSADSCGWGIIVSEVRDTVSSTPKSFSNRGGG